MSEWIQHIRRYANDRGITYGCALSDPNCSITYQAKKLTDIRRKDLMELGRKVIKSRIDKNTYVKQLKETTGMMKEDVNVAKKPKIVITGEKKTIKRPKKKILIIEEDEVVVRPRANTLPTEETLAERAKKSRKPRTPKYATEEERKKAKLEQTLASNKRRYEEKKQNKNKVDNKID
jgi:hypothetical protein